MGYDSLSELSNLLEKADLIPILRDSDSITLFAPSNKAINVRSVAHI